MGQPRAGAMTADDFLDWVLSVDGRYELSGGVPIKMMAGAKQGHNVVTSNVLVSLAPSAKRQGCRTTSSDTAVRTGEYSVRYPDVVVDCGPPDPSAKEASHPTLVVEVSSPGTSEIDATEKLDEYKAHGAIDLIMLIDPDVVFVKLYRHSDDTWVIERYHSLDQVIDLPEVGSHLAVSDVYDTLTPEERPVFEVVGGDHSSATKP